VAAREILLLCSIPTLILSGWYYGWKFLKARNYLLGIEWWVLGFSATNMFAYTATRLEVFGAITYFCDAFSRALGVPLIAMLGLMVVTHRFKPSHVVEALLFASAAIVATLARTLWADAAGLQYFYIATSAAFTFYILYFIWRLARAGFSLHGAAMFVGIAAIWIVALWEGGFLQVPNEDNNLFLNLFFIAHIVWALFFAEIYYAYRALDRSTGQEGPLGTTKAHLEVA